MKTKIAILLCILIPSFVFGQLRGKFSHSYGFGTESITFLTNNRFEYTHHHCTGNDKGKGIYSLNGDNLTLYFQTDTSNDEKPFVVTQKDVANTDSVLIEFSLLNLLEKNDPIIGANVILEDDLGLYKYESQSDLDGKCIFLIPKSQNPLTLKIKSYGIKEYSNKISVDNNYKISISIKAYEFGKTYTFGEIKKFKIKDIKNKSVVLKEDYPEAKFTLYSQ